MQTRIEPELLRYHFDSLYELGNWIDNTRPKWQGTSSKTDHGGYEWDMGVKYSQAVTMAKQGWLEGAQRAQHALKAFTPKDAAPDTKIDFYGFRPHVARFCAGAPDNMIRHTREGEGGSGRVLTLAVPVNFNCMTDARKAANFGVAVAQYVNQLEQQGIRVELIACIANSHNMPEGNDRVIFSWTVKRADQPLDLAVVAFAIGHPAMFRRLGFALLERCDGRECSCYMFPSKAKLTDLINPMPGTYILNGMQDANTHAPTPEAALEYVTQQIEVAMEAQYNDA